MSDFTKEELTEAFNMCDVDGNGAITCAELAGLFEHAAKGAGKEAEYPKAKCEEIAQAIIAKLDGDGDMKVTLEEFLAKSC